LHAFAAACFLGLPAFAQSAPAPETAQPNALIQEMQKVEDAWDSALGKRDQYGLENVLSPQLVDVAATGDVTTRNQDIARLFSKDVLPLSMTQKVLTVRSLAEGIVVVNGTYTLKWPAPQSASTTGTFDEKGIFTQVFKAVDGRWSCLNSQRTVVAEEMPKPKVKTAAPRAKSNAPEPFHIPLIYKGAQSTQPAPAPGSSTPPS